MNRAISGTRLFDDEGDYQDFERLLGETVSQTGMRVLSYSLMPNHWHLLPWPTQPEALSKFMARLTVAHSKRWRAYRGTSGRGHLYQGRFKAFPIQQDDHFFTVCRYIERNALRAGLVQRAEDWPWCSLYHRENNTALGRSLLAPWPIPAPSDWAQRVNNPLTQAELADLRQSTQSGTPFGDAEWITRC